MKRIKLLSWLVVMYMPFSVSAQGNHVSHATKWVTGLNWEEVKAKAAREHKYIFLDCFATWCGPCKAMDKDVYPNDSVGDFLSQHFIAIKVQMDKTVSDDALIKSWYVDASKIGTDYKVNAYPTFLFFASDGKPLHKAVGYRDIEGFKALMRDAQDPQRQYYTMLSNFEKGNIDMSKLKSLARKYSFSGEEFAWKLAADYLKHVPVDSLDRQDNIQFMIEFKECPQVQQFAEKYLKALSTPELCDDNHLLLEAAFKEIPSIHEIVLRYIAGLNERDIKEKGNRAILRAFRDEDEAKKQANRYFSSLSLDEKLTRRNILFIKDFIQRPTDSGFSFFYRYVRQIDSVMNPSNHQVSGVAQARNYGQAIIDNIIKKEELGENWDEMLRNNHNQVPWKKVYSNIERKYGEAYAERNVLEAKVSLYKYFTERDNKHWSDYIKYNIRLIERYGTDTTSGYIDVTVINNFCWDAIFLHSNDQIQIGEAIKLMEGVVRRAPNEDVRLDTYANLLYKARRQKEALVWEGKALMIAEEKKDEGNTKAYRETITKMTAGEPTWVTTNN